MIRLLFVADGPRDSASLPPLVRTILSAEIEAEFRAWKTLRANGYSRKLRFAIRVARDGELAGVVAVVDADRQRDRQTLKKLYEGRTTDREVRPSFPTAVGEARPHVDAWLLDDAEAVRDGLGLPNETVVTLFSKTWNPKESLDRLIKQSQHSGTAMVSDHQDCAELAAIAASVRPERCLHAKSTGFDQFQKDVQGELGTLVKT